MGRCRRLPEAHAWLASVQQSATAAKQLAGLRYKQRVSVGFSLSLCSVLRASYNLTILPGSSGSGLDSVPATQACQPLAPCRAVLTGVSRRPLIVLHQ